MVKKALLLFSAAACLAGSTAKAQTVPCFSDEMNAREKARNPEAVAAAEAQLKAEIDYALGRISIPRLKVTTGDEDTAWKDNAVLRIPVVFHIVHNYGDEYVSDNEVYKQLDEINKIYSGIVPLGTPSVGVIPTYSGNIPGTSIKYVTNTHIQFYLAQKDPFGQPTNGITRYKNFVTYSGGDHAKYDIWPRENYLNIWVVKAFDNTHTGAAAYAYQPPTASAIPWVDGPITAFGQPLNYDNTIAHEIGHSLNLDHPWGSTNSPQVACGDDAVDDTPPTKGHYIPGGCIPQNLYDYECVLTRVDTLGKKELNPSTKKTDNATNVGLKFRTFDKVNIDSVGIYPADSNQPFTIVLKHKNASGAYLPIGSYSGTTNNNKNTASIGLPSPSTSSVLDTQTSLGIKFNTFDSVVIRSLKFYTTAAVAAANSPYTIVLKRNNVEIDSYSGIVTDSNVVAPVSFEIPYTNATDVYSIEFSVNPGAKRQNQPATAFIKTIPNILTITSDSAQGRYNYFYDWSLYTFNYLQYVPVHFQAVIDTNVDAYSMEFSVNPGMHRDANGAGTRNGINNVIRFTSETTQGYYNYFYKWYIRFGDYNVLYSPVVAKKLFNINSSTPVVIDYPDTVNSQNVMDYTYCSKMFTYLQGVRMRAALRSDVAKRDSLITNYNLMITGVADANGNILPRTDLSPIADFSVATPFTCINNSTPTIFTDRSWRDTLSQITWTFSNGATSATQTSTNPVMNVATVSTKFTTPGWVTVNMLAQSNAGKDTLVASDRLYVSDGVSVDPTNYYQEFNPGTDLDQYPIFNYFDNFTKWEVVSNAGYADNTCIRYKQFDTRPAPSQNTPTILGTPRGDWDDFYTPAFDLSDLNSGPLYLTFFTSGAFRTNDPTKIGDTLEISYSATCGNAWFPLKKLTTTDIGNQGVRLNDYTPGGFWDWQAQNITLSPTTINVNRNKIFFRFRYKPGANPFTLIGSGNNFYLDRIHIGKWTTDVEDVANKAAGVTLAPNPTTGSTSVIIKDAKSSSAQITVTDIAGKLVYSASVSLNNSINRVEIPANYIAVKGMYLVSVVTGSQKQTEKLIVY